MICPYPSKKRKNFILKYHAIEDTILGTSYTDPQSYDLMEVVIVNLGYADKESELEILDLLNVLFSTSATPEEKKKRLHEDFDIAMTEEFESEVRDMCNLSRALVDQGIEQGMKQGVEKEKMSLAQMMIEEKEPVDKISKYTGYAIDKLKEIAAAMGQTLV